MAILKLFWAYICFRWWYKETEDEAEAEKYEKKVQKKVADILRDYKNEY
jgi:hypothetical protein